MAATTVDLDWGLAALGVTGATSETRATGVRVTNLESTVIHAVHGMTPDGDWFLLADVAPEDTNRHLASDRAKDREANVWLVILGQRDRDIIMACGQDA